MGLVEGTEGLYVGLSSVGFTVLEEGRSFVGYGLYFSASGLKTGRLLTGASSLLISLSTGICLITSPPASSRDVGTAFGFSFSISTGDGIGLDLMPGTCSLTGLSLD